MNKKKFKKLCDRYFNANTIKLIILAVPMIFLLVEKYRVETFSIKEYLSTDIFFTAALLFVCNLIANFTAEIIGKACEDAVKLSTDYTSLAKKYKRENLITHHGTRFPVQELAFRRLQSAPFELVIDQKNSAMHYRLPTQIADISDHLMESHRHSLIFNKMNIRVDDLIVEGQKVTLVYSHTTYFDSMLTNRAMDYPWKNGKTVREVYEPGPFLSPLSLSRLSNHLGFNGFVETADGKIIFVKRSNNLSIGKRTLADSIGASMKVEFCCDNDRRLTVEGIANAIRKEVSDELKITINDDHLENSIFAFYRDIVEGGKPQFLFYYRIDKTFEEFQENFKKVIKNNRKENKKTAKVDGYRFYGFDKDQLRGATILPGELIVGKKRFHMMPSASAAILMLLRALETD